MLFLIEQVHTPENCPYGRGGSPSLYDANADGIRLIGAYGSFMEHVIYYIVEASDTGALNTFLLPGMKTCTATIKPVSERPFDRSQS